MIEFQEWPKTPRLNREMVITEKIDGTNSAVGIKRLPDPSALGYEDERSDPNVIALTIGRDGGEYALYAQSRKRLIRPGKATDNFGFAGWVRDNAQALTDALGHGLHYGEWWGKGIQRGYGRDERYFSLFNVNRYGGIDFVGLGLSNVRNVPVLYRGPFSTQRVNDVVEYLRFTGSHAAFGYSRPEGVIVFHSAGQHVYKVLLEGDEAPKSVLGVA